MILEARYYYVESFDGDYVNLRREDDTEGNTVFVARALLPEEIREGSRLKYEMLQYEMADKS